MNFIIALAKAVATVYGILLALSLLGLVSSAAAYLAKLNKKLDRE